MESRVGDTLPNLQDMLRYDVAFQSVADPHLIAFPSFATKSGTLGGRVTQERWYSFGVKLVGWDDNLTLGSIHLKEWVTYRHPRDKNGQEDYSKLVQVTLQAFCEEK